MKVKRNCGITALKAKYFWICVTPWAIGLVLFFILPIVQSLIYSFCSVKLLSGGVALHFQGLKNFKYIFAENADYTDYIAQAFIKFAYSFPIILILSLILAIAGVVLISGEELQYNFDGMYGIIIGLISAGMLAASMIMIKKVHEEEPTALFSLMFILSLSGALVLIIPSLIFNSDNLYPTTFTDWGLVFIYGAVMQCVAWGMIAYTIPYLSLGLTGLLLLSEPVVALVIDYFGLDKPINHWQWAGAVLTLVAIYLGSQKNKTA